MSQYIKRKTHDDQLGLIQGMQAVSTFKNQSMHCITSIDGIRKTRGAWVAKLVKRLTSAEVMILWLMSSSPLLGSVLTAQRLEPALDSVSPSLSVSPLLKLCLSLSQK